MIYSTTCDCSDVRLCSNKPLALVFSGSGGGERCEEKCFYNLQQCFFKTRAAPFSFALFSAFLLFLLPRARFSADGNWFDVKTQRKHRHKTKGAPGKM